MDLMFTNPLDVHATPWEAGVDSQNLIYNLLDESLVGVQEID
jgi:hypothetical protein